ncbi:MAG: nucleotidyltransferase domain-containing protein [Thermoplasmata archaeon]
MIDRMSAQLLQALGRGRMRFRSLQRIVPNPRTLSAKLKGLVELGLVKKEDGYCLTPGGERALPHVKELERILRPQPRVTVERVPHDLFRPYLKRFAGELVRRFDVTGVLLFGSVARGDWSRDSDIDLLVILEEGREALKVITALRAELRSSPEYKECVSKDHYPVVQVYPIARSDARRFRRMYLDALTEGIILFERDSFLSDLIAEFKERLRELGARRIDIPSTGHYWILGDIEAGKVVDL